jgi:hypothetical protein
MDLDRQITTRLTATPHVTASALATALRVKRRAINRRLYRMQRRGVAAKDAAHRWHLTRERRNAPPKGMNACQRCGSSTAEPWHSHCARCYSVVNPAHAARRDHEALAYQAQQRRLQLLRQAGHQNWSDDT